MKNTYTLSFHLYRTILFLVVPLFLIGNFMIGSAGHNSSLQLSDYLILAFSLLTPIVLTIVKKIDTKETLTGKTFNLIAKLLVLLGAIILLIGIYEQLKIYLKIGFTTGAVVTVIVLLSLLILSLILLMGLLKNKI